MGPALLLERIGLEVATFYEEIGGVVHHSIEIPYRSTYTLDEEVLEDPATVRASIEPLGGWIASMMVSLSDSYLR